MYLKPVCASFCSELLSKSGLTHVCHYSWNGQLWQHQNDCTFHSLSMGGAHSQVEASITSPTFPPYVGKKNSQLCSTHSTVDISILQHCSTNGKLRIPVKAQPSTPSTWPLSHNPTICFIPNLYIILAFSRTLLLFNTPIQMQGWIKSN